MRTKVEPGRLILEDSPGCFWLFGLFFLLLGSLPIAGLLGLFAEPWKVRGWQAPAAVLMGLAAVAAGVYVVYTSPRSRVSFDVTRGQVSVARRGLLRREGQRFGLDELRAVEVVEDADGEGDPVYTVRMRLTRGEPCELSSLWIPNRRHCEERVAEIRAFLEQAGKRLEGEPPP